MSTIKFKVAAKTDMGVVRTNNEDNFQVASDLSSGQMRWINNEICSLGELGALLVVADGMGGMNAGEVASELAIETVREYFTLENLTPEVTKNRYSVEKFMNNVIVAADARIKKEAQLHPESRGMGTTIVIAWILNGKLYVSWCGDSRAYVYNPNAGLHQITKDHSYVQSLVDNGTLSRDEAFDFPDSNIITRSLCDGAAKAKPESLMTPYELCDNDIVLLCTDGLNGMIRDVEIEAVIRNNSHNMDTLVDDLIHAACEAEGSDNVTICLCKILQGGATCNPVVFEEYENRLNGGSNKIVRTLIKTGSIECRKSLKLPLVIILSAVILLALAGFAWWYFSKPAKEEVTDTVQVEANQEDKNNEVEPSDASPTQDKKEDNKPKATETTNPKTNLPGSILKKTKTEEQQPSEEDVLSPVKDLDNGSDDDVITPVENSGDVEENKVKTEPEKTESPKVEDKEEKTKSSDKITPVNKVQAKKTTKEYKVKADETYYGIARKFGVKIKDLQELNGNKKLKIGDIILVPVK